MIPFEEIEAKAVDHSSHNAEVDVDDVPNENNAYGGDDAEIEPEVVVEGAGYDDAG